MVPPVLPACARTSAWEPAGAVATAGIGWADAEAAGAARWVGTTIAAMTTPMHRADGRLYMRVAVWATAEEKWRASGVEFICRPRLTPRRIQAALFRSRPQGDEGGGDEDRGCRNKAASRSARRPWEPRTL